MAAAGDAFEKRILVTGGAGFIASHVVIRLVKNYPQYHIVNFDKLDYCSSLKNLDSISDAPNYTFIKGSVCSPDLVNYVLRTEKITHIMHFAAQTHVDNSFGNSFTFTENNILGTHVLLEGAKLLKSQLKLFLHVSTDEVYGEGKEGDDAAMHEGSILEPTNPYAATKAGAEYLVKAYARSFGLPTLITRGNNVYGPHQFPEKIIPKFINQLLRGHKVTLHGDGQNTRNYLFVEDVAAAFDLVLHKGKPGEIFNVGGDNEVPNIDVARLLIRKIMGADADTDEWITLVPDRPFNDLRYPLDSTRLRDLGWVEEVSWEDGLARTVEWYKKFSGNWDDVESALVAHPRRGHTERELTGHAETGTDEAAGGAGKA
uniref:NAD(P)-binding domain-containing protein n=1 Tax=Bicosoecida sp. CB-2014 TaxID=1486930 RepID=A0A7S1CN91_9STRA|mmetsp:Transcript_5100/g.18346  ORF Transcript_5100/g.18346 Transcript_5100/m.18346 type:complete len:372 (+) Transcript_5100:178-1293(+)